MLVILKELIQLIYKRELSNETYLTQEQMNIIINSQRLWLQLAFTIRSLMITVMRDPERTPVVANQLYSVITNNFYNYFRFFYGPEIAQQFVNLISNYITHFWRLFEALHTNNSEAINSNTSELYRSVDQIASFLASINVYWSEEQWRSFLYQFTRTKIEQALALATKDFDREYQLYRSIEDYAVLMGDYMARGIISRSTASKNL